jgi:hypothetical protein
MYTRSTETAASNKMKANFYGVLEYSSMKREGEGGVMGNPAAIDLSLIQVPHTRESGVF